MFRDATLIQNFFVGMLLPLVIAIINQRSWPPPIKGLVALAMCIFAAAILVIIRGELNALDWAGTLVVIFTTAFGFYKMLWKPSEIAPRIEAATSTSDRPPALR